MKKTNYKTLVDIPAMLLVVAAIITGFMLHDEVWHQHIYDNPFLWTFHEIIGLLLLVLAIVHCVQHSFWFKSYTKIILSKKRVTTILLIIGVIVVISGGVLMCGSHSEPVSHIHYVSGILFTILAIGHVAKRWKMLRALL